MQQYAGGVSGGVERRLFYFCSFDPCKYAQLPILGELLVRQRPLSRLALRTYQDGPNCYTRCSTPSKRFEWRVVSCYHQSYALAALAMRCAHSIERTFIPHRALPMPGELPG